MNKIIYLDSAASAQKPAAVIDAQNAFLRDSYANAGRGICARAAHVDELVATARASVADFIGAAAPHQIVFTSGTTDSMNMIADLIASRVRTVAVSDLDHHSARLPFMANGRYDVVLMPLDSNFNIDIARVPRADAVIITAMSNVLGVGQDVAAIVRAARAANPDVITVVDAAQYVAHEKMDVTGWGADFVCFSGHKIGADTGVGVMYIRNPDDYAPVRFGGGMITRIADDGTIMTPAAPDRFEAGTLPLTQIIGLPYAIDAWRAWDGGADVRHYIYDELAAMTGVRLLTGRDAALISFVVDGMHALDFGALVGARGLCLRVGNMCASWIHRALDIPASIRISNGPWNTPADAAAATDIIRGVIK